jgi:hypothetical protein
MTRQQIADLIRQVSDLAATLRGVESEAAAEPYRQLGLRLTYYPDKKVVRAAAAPQPDNIGKWSVSEGRIHPNPNACSQVNSPLGLAPTAVKGDDLCQSACQGLRAEWVICVLIRIPDSRVLAAGARGYRLGGGGRRSLPGRGLAGRVW